MNPIQATSDSASEFILDDGEGGSDLAVIQIDGVECTAPGSGGVSPRLARRNSHTPRNTLARANSLSPQSSLSRAATPGQACSCGALPAASALGLHPDIAIGPPLRPDPPVPEFHQDGSEVLWLAAVFGSHAGGPNRDVVRVTEGSHHAYN